MHAWITDRPLKKRPQREDNRPRLQLPLPQPTTEREEKRDSKAEDDSSPRGVVEVDFYI